MNKVIMTGTLVKDAELTKSLGGLEFYKNTIAVNKSYKDKFGQKQQETLFLDFVIFNQSAINAANWTNKGDKLLIEGELKENIWQGNDGQQKRKMSLTVSNWEILKRKEIKEEKVSKEEVQKPITRETPINNPTELAPRQNNPQQFHDDEEIPF